MGSQDADDWRISGQEKYLTGAIFSFRAYTPPGMIGIMNTVHFAGRNFAQTNKRVAVRKGT